LTTSYGVQEVLRYIERKIDLDIKHRLPLKNVIIIEILFLNRWFHQM